MTTISKETLTKFENIEHLSQFLHNCVNNLSKEPVETLSPDQKALQEIIKNYFLQRAVEESYPLPAELPNSFQKTLDTVFKLRYKDILNILAKEKLVNKGYKLLENYDWKLKWVLGSSKLASIREPVCQLELYCVSLDENLKSNRNLISFECDLRQVEELITVLTNVKNIQ